MSLASLPMYDRPELALAHDRLWQAVHTRLGRGPERLTRGGDPWDHWLAPDLVLSQTCGLPFSTRLRGRVALVGTGDYRLDDCPPGHYYSVFVARTEDARSSPADFATARLACNDPHSQSGWGAPLAWARARGFRFTRPSFTGAHARSAAEVAEGRADIAALDALTWRLITRHDPGVAARLRVIGRTPPTPALPFITAPARDPAPVFVALSAALAALSADDREVLSLHAIVRLPESAWLAVPVPPAPASELASEPER